MKNMHTIILECKGLNIAVELFVVIYLINQMKRGMQSIAEGK